MKKFIQRASKSFNIPSALNPTAPAFVPSSPALTPKFVVPAVPHPSPHTHLALLVTTDGLLIRPHVLGPQPFSSYVRMSWEKEVKLEELSGDGEADWNDSVIVYGIIGILKLFSASYLLVITSKAEIGNLLEPTHSVYGVKGVTAIPLEEDRARMVINTLASRNSLASRPSLLPSTTLDSIHSPNKPGRIEEEDSDAQFAAVPSASPARVQFSPEPHVKIMTPRTADSDAFHDQQDGVLLRSSSPTPSDQSGASTPSTADSTAATPIAPIAKALATRLSFWSRLSKRSSLFPSTADLTTESFPSPSITQVTHQELDHLVREERGEPKEVLHDILAATAPPPVSTAEKHSELEDKIVKEVIREYVKGGMFFAYNFDITRSLQHKQEQGVKAHRQSALLADLMPNSKYAQDGDTVNPLSEPYATLPLWRRVDRQYWWNEWLSKPFVDAGLHPYVLPIMQGYYQVTSFHIYPDAEVEDDVAAVDYIVVSRRSRDRAGLRYQRRGVDDDAHVANFVETESVMRVEREGVSNIFSYVQIRGSIPLFWTQTGYGLKPPPLLAGDRTPAQHLEALKRHFSRTTPLYGPHSIVNLAENQGKEGAVTSAYRTYVKQLDDENVQYNEYDFHAETKGMKYENISKLIDSMERTFEQQGYLWISNNTIMSTQKGVFRVNCIDCLDRTNVVQSAFARFALNRQLSAVALHNPEFEGRSETDVVFNDVWANNGDAISRAYAGTSALKGDFTRTGKRDLTGLLNDGVNSLARMYSSTFSDWFSQAVIDFMLGNRTVSVFSEFLLKLQSSDPRDLLRLSKIRAEAIATSVERVLVEGERLLGGWTLFAPTQLNVKIGGGYEEKVLLLTGRALYIISFDYTLEKVKLYTRVPLGDITGITKGTYIMSPLEEASRDPVQNAGFMVSWLNNNQTTRVSSYSVRNTPVPSSPGPATPRTPWSSRPPPSTKHQRTGSVLFDIANSRLSVTLKESNPFKNGTMLSNILSSASMAFEGSEKSFAAFKMLPMDPARFRRTSSSDREHAGVGRTELQEAATCKEAADLIVEAIRKACEDVGSAHGDFVKEGEVVSLAEAQEMTGMYAKLEYGVKRLLWLGSA